MTELTRELIERRLQQIRNMEYTEEYGLPAYLEFEVALCNLALSAPSDLVAVPREPTQEMIDAGCKANMTRQATAEIFRAMISAWENRG